MADVDLDIDFALVPAAAEVRPVLRPAPVRPARLNRKVILYFVLVSAAGLWATEWHALPVQFQAGAHPFQNFADGQTYMVGIITMRWHDSFKIIISANVKYIHMGRHRTIHAA